MSAAEEYPGAPLSPEALTRARLQLCVELLELVYGEVATQPRAAQAIACTAMIIAQLQGVLGAHHA